MTATGAAGLAAQAEAVLAANWRDGSTVPSGNQYPHQWGWDAAYIALGWSWLDEGRAAQELESLLRGQWADGRVPHIVFDPGVDENAYFPGPASWDSAGAPGGPAGVATSGLTQPPLHARAALEVAERTSDGAAAEGFLRRVFPRLVAQHDYLARRRDAGGAGLAAIVHPWESGLDDSPAWDEPLAAVELPLEGVAHYERRDRLHVDPDERPSDAAYDRFVHLMRAYQDGGYADDDLADGSAFLVEDPLFNAIWLWSTHALAAIAERIGEDAGPYREAASGLHAALRSRLWDAARGASSRATCGPAGWWTGGPSSRSRRCSTRSCRVDVAGAVAAELGSPHFHSEAGIGVASADLLGAEFSRRRYWRGPVWANLNWLLARGLRQHGLDRPGRPARGDDAAVGGAGRHPRVLRPADGRGKGQ